MPDTPRWQSLVSALSQHGLDGADVCDAMWLWSRSDISLPSSVHESTSPNPQLAGGGAEFPRKQQSVDELEEIASTEADESDSPPPPNSGKDTPAPPKRQSQPTPSRVPVYPDTDWSDGDQPAHRITLPGASTYSRELELMQALRPLRVRRPDYRRLELDEEATVERISQTGVWAPVMRARPSRWLDLTLVVEQAPTMRMWQDAGHKLAHDLQRGCAPRRFSTATVETGSDGTLRIASPSGRRTSPLPGGHVILFSDALSLGWLHGTVPVQLWHWQKSSTVILLQPLPPLLWSRTSLRKQLPTPLHLARQTTRSPLPVVSLDPLHLANLATTLAGRAQRPVAALTGPPGIFRENPPPVVSTTPFDPATLSADHIEQVRRQFVETASPQARVLANYLASVPRGWLQLPIMQLIQRQLVTDAAPWALAEIFLSGLLYRRHLPSPSFSEEITYDYLPTLRDHFRDKAPLDRQIEIRLLISHYISTQQRSTDTLTGQVHCTSPEEANASIATSAEPFADLPIYRLPALATSDSNVPLEKLPTQQSAPRAPLETSTRPLNEARLIILGRGRAGKSSLRDRLVHNTFDEHKPGTPGIDIQPWELHCHGEDLRLHVWDFAGQEITHATHQFFLTGRSIYLLVLEGRTDNQDRDAEYWLRLISTFGKDSPIIIALNLWDERRFDVDRNLLRQRYPAIKAFIPTDCKSQRSIDELRRTICDVLRDLEGVHEPFPTAWWSVKEYFSAATHNYIKYAQFRTICVEKGIVNSDEQDSLARILHDLGIILHYGEDARLKDTTVLSPQWVTSGVYKLLRLNDGNPTDGTLTIKDATAALPEEPAEMVLYLIELMRRFDLCYPLDDSDTCWLVPQVLTKYQPELPAYWQDATTDLTTRLRYLYKFIPAGLLPRFIVRTHPLSEGRKRWRNGVELAFGGAEALVKVEPSENRLTIIVRGPGSDRLRLVQLIRAQFQAIHDSIPSLAPAELIENANQPGVYEDIHRLEVAPDNHIRTTIHRSNDAIAVEQDPQLNTISPRVIPSAPIRVFVSYSQRDIRHLDIFKQNLEIMKMNGLITLWHDGLIKTGSEWDQDIRRELEEADIIIFMVSTNFLASDYIRGVEMARAIQRKEAGEAELVSLLLEPDCGWKAPHLLKLRGTQQTITCNLKRYQAIYPANKSAKRWPTTLNAFNHVEKALTKLREHILARRKHGLQEPQSQQSTIAPRSIYLSCVSSEFMELRNRLQHHLTVAGLVAKTQEDIPQANVNILEQLDGQIATCDAIIHICGDQSGALVHPQTISRFLKARPTFLSTQPALRKALGDFSDVTYTQLEVFIAIHHNRPVLLYQLHGAKSTHLTRLKLGGRYGSEFHSETDILGKLIGDLQNIVPTTPTRFVSNIPASIGDHFVGRDSVLTTLHQRLFRSDIPHGSPPQVVSGLAGIGKTRVAIEYAHRFSESYVTRLFIQADSPESLHHNFANLTAPHSLNLPEYNELNEEARTRAVHQWLNSHPGWLLILDNVDTEKAATAVEWLLPKLISGHVLITSRLSKWGAQVSVFDLELLAEEDAIAFLLYRISPKLARSTSDREDVKTIANKLDGLALALEQAAAYISEKRISFAEYVKRFEEQPTQVLHWHNPRRIQYPTPFTITLLPTLNQLSTTARDLLDTLSYFSSDPIPHALIRENELEDALMELSTFSLIRWVSPSPDAFSMHRLVQETAITATSDSQSRQAKKRATNLLASAVPGSGHDPLTWPEWQLLAPHCKHLCASTLPDDKSPETATILSSYASYLFHGTADYSTAEEWCQRALALRQKLLGEDHPDTLSSAANLAEILATQSRFEEAQPLSIHTWQTRIRLLGRDHPDTLTSANNHAQLLYFQGKVTEAAPIFESTLRAREKVLPPNAQDTIVSASDLGLAYWELGKTREAEALLKRAVDGNRLTLGSDHPATLTSLENLALILEEQGKYEESQNLRLQSLALTSQIFGPTHPDTLTSRHNLGHLNQLQKEYEEARLHYVFVIKLRKEILGPEHPLTLLTEHKLATTYKEQACFALALSIYRRISPIADRVLGADSSDAVLYRKQLQVCLSKLAL